MNAMIISTININDILFFKNEKISYMLNSNLIRIEKFIILFIIILNLT